ncbi:MAG: transcription termination factor NusA [Rickettsiales bacterium]
MIKPGEFSSEIIQIADAVAREKNIARQLVIEALESAIAVASRKKYGIENEIKVTINPTSGATSIFRIREVAEDIEDNHTQISLEEAKLRNPEAKVGDKVEDPLPPIDIARVAAQSAKQVIMQKVREAEREKQYEEFKDKAGEIINGTVKRVEFGSVVVDLGRGEGMMRRDSTIRGETFKPNDRIRAYIEEVKRDNKGYQVMLSRVSNEFLAKLFAQEVPEIYDGVIQIKAIARDPGLKSKIAVYTSDSSIDPVGSCVGVRGSRVQGVINELRGEKIDIIQWTEDTAKFVINSLSPADVGKVVIDEDKNRIEVVVPAEQLSIAIGRKGQNVRLASQLTGWSIDVLTDEEESKRRAEEFNSSTNLFVEKLGVEEVLAQLLSVEGFSNIDDLAYVSVDELGGIEGIDEELAEELISRAQKISEKENVEVNKEIKALGVDKEIIDTLGLLPKYMLILAKEGIKSFEDLAEISPEEFNSILPDSGLSKEQVIQLINHAKEVSKTEETEEEASE